MHINLACNFKNPQMYFKTLLWDRNIHIRKKFIMIKCSKKKKINTEKVNNISTVSDSRYIKYSLDNICKYLTDISPKTN